MKKEFLIIVVLNDGNNSLVNREVNLHRKASTAQEAMVLAHKLKFVSLMLRRVEYLLISDVLLYI